MPAFVADKVAFYRTNLSYTSNPCYFQNLLEITTLAYLVQLSFSYNGRPVTLIFMAMYTLYGIAFLGAMKSYPT